MSILVFMLFCSLSVSLIAQIINTCCAICFLNPFLFRNFFSLVLSCQNPSGSILCLSHVLLCLLIKPSIILHFFFLSSLSLKLTLCSLDRLNHKHPDSIQLGQVGGHFTPMPRRERKSPFPSKPFRVLGYDYNCAIPSNYGEVKK